MSDYILIDSPGDTIVVDESSDIILTEGNDEIVVESVGIEGPMGPPAAVFEFTQSSPSSLWIINHNLGFYPAVSLVTAGGVSMDGNPINTSVNQVQVNFSLPVAGKARLN